ncbi:MAG: DUF5009 domain-containing protein [Cyclobacteriaceae bacterium]|nr:DUF5009 domain-containing protein [Cyclobacteriaceae bacterium]
MLKNERLISLDAFRGLTILLMIVVNTPGSWAYVYAPFRHSKWHGATPTDLVFPFFLFIIGVSMWFSFKKYNHRMSAPVFYKIAKRTALIFLIGLLLNAFPKFNFEHLRIMGVLQRIALAYGFASVAVLVLPKTGRWLFSAVILMGYWALMYAMGGSNPYSLEHNFARGVDISIFGDNHVYKGFGIAFDPEGLLSTLPAAINVVFGYLVGEIIATTKEFKKIIGKLIPLGVAGMLVGLFWDLVLPINKPIWTSSYVVYTVGISLLVLSLFIWIIDVKGFKKWATPLLIYGTNPLLIFVLSIVWVKIIIYLVHFGQGNNRISGYSWLYQTIFVPIGGNMFGSLLFALFHGVLFWAVGYILYKKKIFLKL